MTIGLAQVPAPLPIQGVSGDEFALVVTLTDINGDPLSIPLDPEGTVYRSGQEVDAWAPTVSYVSTGVYSVSWTAAQTSALNAQSLLSWALQLALDSSGPFYAILAGPVKMSDPFSPGTTTTNQSFLLTLASTVVNVAVAL